MHLARFPRVRFFPAPTPLEKLDNLTRHLGGPEIWIKRDDCTVVATGGNKVRKLEWLAGEALAQGADHLITQGAVQSNHVRQTAAVARKLGMQCTALLEHRVETNDRDYLNSGNVLLDKLFDCAIEYRPPGLDMNAEAEAKGQALREAGGKPYVIPGGGSNRVGALGYVSCAQELMQQADEMGLRIDRIVTATGSAGTHAGLVVGLQGCNANVPVLGIGVRNPKDRQEAAVHKLAEATAEYVGVHGGIPPGVGGGELRLYRRRLRPADRGHEGSRAHAGEPGGHPAGPGVFRQGDGRVDRPDPQGQVRQERAAGIPAHRRRGRAVRLHRGVRGIDREAGENSPSPCGAPFGRELGEGGCMSSLGTGQPTHPPALVRFAPKPATGREARASRGP